jgi:hypothetical protein
MHVIRFTILALSLTRSIAFGQNDANRRCDLLFIDSACTILQINPQTREEVKLVSLEFCESLLWEDGLSNHVSPDGSMLLVPEKDSLFLAFLANGEYICLDTLFDKRLVTLQKFWLGPNTLCLYQVDKVSSDTPTIMTLEVHEQSIRALYSQSVAGSSVRLVYLHPIFAKYVSMDNRRIFDAVALIGPEGLQAVDCSTSPSVCLARSDDLLPIPRGPNDVVVASNYGGGDRISIGTFFRRKVDSPLLPPYWDEGSQRYWWYEYNFGTEIKSGTQFSTTIDGQTESWGSRRFIGSVCEE